LEVVKIFSQISISVALILHMHTKSNHSQTCSHGL